ncbi:hypothetical protein C8R44DRAFT_734170 [Mycena epipterygia]|nr:hypothetical protein C8R44DRAFT_734170 [Mycena epipterygia]
MSRGIRSSSGTASGHIAPTAASHRPSPDARITAPLFGAVWLDPPPHLSEPDLAEFQLGPPQHYTTCPPCGCSYEVIPLPRLSTGTSEYTVHTEPLSELAAVLRSAQAMPTVSSDRKLFEGLNLYWIGSRSFLYAFAEGPLSFNSHPLLQPFLNRYWWHALGLPHLALKLRHTIAHFMGFPSATRIPPTPKGQ